MPKKVTTTAMTKYDERLAQMAKSAKKAIAVQGGGNFISLRGGMMSYQSATIPNNTMRCIVIDAIIDKPYYEGAFDPDNFSTPRCYALGRDKSEMAPNPDQVPDPISPACSGCPNNVFGSADVGKGKACKDYQRLALITEGDLDNVEEAEIAYMRIPVTSGGNWAKLVDDYESAYHKPPLAFITEISVVKDSGNRLPGWHVEFKMADEIKDADVLDALLTRYDAVSREIFFPYPEATEGAEEEAQTKAPAPKKKVVRAKGTNGSGSPKPPRREAIIPPAPVAATASAPAKVGVRRPVKAPKF